MLCLKKDGKKRRGKGMRICDLCLKPIRWWQKVHSYVRHTISVPSHYHVRCAKKIGIR